MDTLAHERRKRVTESVRQNHLSPSFIPEQDFVLRSSHDWTEPQPVPYLASSLELLVTAGRTSERTTMARKRASTSVNDEQSQQQQSQEDVEDDVQQSSRKRQRPNKGKASASNNGHGNGNGNGSESEGEALTDDEEAVRAALRGWTLDSFTDKPIQVNKAVQQQVSVRFSCSVTP